MNDDIFHVLSLIENEKPSIKEIINDNSFRSCWSSKVKILRDFIIMNFDQIISIVFGSSKKSDTDGVAALNIICSNDQDFHLRIINETNFINFLADFPKSQHTSFEVSSFMACFPHFIFNDTEPRVLTSLFNDALFWKSLLNFLWHDSVLQFLTDTYSCVETPLLFYLDQINFPDAIAEYTTSNLTNGYILMIQVCKHFRYHKQAAQALLKNACINRSCLYAFQSKSIRSFIYINEIFRISIQREINSHFKRIEMIISGFLPKFVEIILNTPKFNGISKECLDLICLILPRSGKDNTKIIKTLNDHFISLFFNSPSATLLQLSYVSYLAVIADLNLLTRETAKELIAQTLDKYSNPNWVQSRALLRQVLSIADQVDRSGHSQLIAWNNQVDSIINTVKTRVSKKINYRNWTLVIGLILILCSILFIKFFVEQ